STTSHRTRPVCRVARRPRWPGTRTRCASWSRNRHPLNLTPTAHERNIMIRIGKFATAVAVTAALLVAVTGCSTSGTGGSGGSTGPSVPKVPELKKLGANENALNLIVWAGYAE